MFPVRYEIYLFKPRNEINFATVSSALLVIRKHHLHLNNSTRNRKDITRKTVLLTIY
jgi:hypothetical protein